MSSRLGHKLPKQTDAKIFEQMVRDCANKKYNKEFSLYGRTGQNQHGIDIYCVDRFAEVIQCKNYTTNKRNALQDAINSDFQSAYEYFYNEKNWHFKSFIIATSADKDIIGDNIIIENNLKMDIKIEIWFWEDIEEIILENPDLLLKYYKSFVVDFSELNVVHTDNEIYAKSFSESLFSHKNGNKVNLCDLFVMPKYINENDELKSDLQDKIYFFVKSDKRFLFIEGDAGCGKSMLVGWMNYNEMKSDNDGSKINIFDKRPIITIRLRNLNREMILIDSILKWMNLETLEDMEKRFPKAVMILDGFDEWYNDSADDNELIRLDQNLPKEYKCIIMSRPYYIKKEINILCEFITLEEHALIDDKLNEWLYESVTLPLQQYYFKLKEITKDIFENSGYHIEKDSNQSVDIIARNDETLYYIDMKYATSPIYRQIGNLTAAINRIKVNAEKNNAIPVLVIYSLVPEKAKERYDESDLIILDISNILYMVQGTNLMDELISILPFSVDEMQQIKPKKIQIEKKINTMLSNLLKRLDNCPPGKEYATEFENMCFDFLKDIFSDDLSLWNQQEKSNQDLYRFDLVCRIKDNNNKTFWRMMEKFFNSKYIIFEFKNYTKEITQKEIYTTEKYLYQKALRNVAIIIARNGYDDNAMWAAKGCLRESGKLIVLITVEDLKEMYLLKKDFQDPSEYLLNKIDKLLSELEK